VRVLVLGGTSFVGRAIVEALLPAASVTLFSRGRTGAGLFPSAPRLFGDRASGDYRALRGSGPWDAVVDVTAYFPWQVGQAMDAVDGRVGRYRCNWSTAARWPGWWRG
jgi:2'-hydroxyisoflavone reductase